MADRTHPDLVDPADRLTLYDRVVGYFNPVQKVVRMKARELEHQFSYGYNDNTWERGKSGGMFAHASAETWRSNRDRLKAMWDARDLCQFEFIGGMVARVVLYTLGQIHSKSLTGVPQIDESYDNYFHGWCGDSPGDDGLIRCDLTGRHRLRKMAQLGFTGFLVDGDHGFVEVDPGATPTGEFCLQAVEADRIGSPLEQQVQENYIGGIGIDPENGRVQLYRVFHRTRTNQYINPQDLPADSFIHIHDPDRSDEYRGRTKLLRLLNDARDIREWINSEKIAGKTQSQWAALIGVKDPFRNAGSTSWSDRNEQGTPTQQAEWGKILKMAEGEVFSMLAPPSRPSGAFIEFIQMVIRKMAISLDLPYGFLWDLATLGGVTARIEVQQALRRIEYWQQIMIDKMLNRVRQKVIAQGIARGELQPHPNWRACSWHFGLSIQTDVGYEMESDVAGLQSGIRTVDDICQKWGKSPREVFRSNAATANEAIDEGAAAGIPVETFAPTLYPNLTSQKAAIEAGPQPPPAPGTIEAVGDKGIKQIIDLIKAVGEGKADKDAAEHTLIYSYGIPEEIAKKMIPDEPSKSKLKLLNPSTASKPTGAKVKTTKKSSK